MKFYCDNCNTKYGIADEKVRGKVLRVRCKKCSNVITVRENAAPDKAATTGSPSPPPLGDKVDPADVPWHYSRNGQSFGPLTFSVLEGRFASGDLGDECYVWTDSMSGWKPVGQVDAFDRAVAAGRQIKPRPDTVGVSGALEAVDPADFDADEATSDPESRPEEDGDKSTDEQTTDETSGASTAAAAPLEAAPEAERRKDRLAKLRDRLASNSESSAGPKDSDGLPTPSAGSEPVFEPDLMADGGSSDDKEGSEGSSGRDFLGQEPVGDDPGVRTSQEQLAPTVAPAAESGRVHSDGPPRGEPTGANEPPPEGGGEHSGLFADIDAPDGSSDEPDHIPFMPGAPRLKSDSEAVAGTDGQSEGITGSLLIQLDNIQKEGRGKKALAVIGVVVLLGAVVGTSFYVTDESDPEPSVAGAGRGVEAVPDHEAVQHTYTKEELRKIRSLDGRQPDDRPQAERESGGGTADKSAPAASPQQEAPARAAKKRRAVPTPSREGDDSTQQAALDEAFESASKHKDNADGLDNGIDDGKITGSALDSSIAGHSDLFDSRSAINSNRSKSVYNPTDSLADRRKNTSTIKAKLSRKQISQGMHSVRQSVGVCRQRHSRRGTPLDTPKIYLTLTVESSGRISEFSMAPDRLDNTVFARCLKTHRTRWKFPSFDGHSQQMRAPFVIQ